MEAISEFVKQNYWLFTIISAILILALIGYIVEAKSSKDVKIKKSKFQNVPTAEDEIDTI